MSYEQIVAERVKNLRETRNVEQKELAAYLKISQSALSNYENGARKFPLSLIPALADFFGVSIDYLYGREGN